MAGSDSFIGSFRRDQAAWESEPGAGCGLRAARHLHFTDRFLSRLHREQTCIRAATDQMRRY